MEFFCSTWKREGAARGTFFLGILLGHHPVLGQRNVVWIYSFLPLHSFLCLLPATSFQDIWLFSVFIHWSFHRLNVGSHILLNTTKVWPPLVTLISHVAIYLSTFCFTVFLTSYPVPGSWTEFSALHNPRFTSKLSSWKPPTYTLLPLQGLQWQMSVMDSLLPPSHNIYWQCICTPGLVVLSSDWNYELGLRVSYWLFAYQFLCPG